MQRQPWESCAYCHGEAASDGVPPMPVIDGQSGYYIRKQLADMRAGWRTDPSRMMQSALVLLESADERIVARYFSRRPSPAWTPDEEWTPGASLYWNGRPGVPACAGCHGGPDNSSLPRLFGQGKAYLLRQLEAFGSGVRANDPGGVMRHVAAALDARERDAVTEYLAGR